MPAKISRSAYADMFGPTTGDKVRLADTDLIIEVEKDFTTYGEEVKFGGGKVIRDGMGQSQQPAAQVVDATMTHGPPRKRIRWGDIAPPVILFGFIVAVVSTLVGIVGNPDLHVAHRGTHFD